MKWLSNILIVFLLTGCSGVIKQSWTNFRAHYNTYYNAEKSFKAGQEKVLSQNLLIDPEKPIRIHRELPQAGAEEFKNTIEKGAQIIRKFPDSKWIDDALFLMGKSYYYRKEFYLGLQKFEELYETTTDKDLKLKSVIWKGRTLLDLKQYGEALSFLQEQLSGLVENVDSEHKAELHVLIAEHHAMLGNWQEALDQLKLSVTKLGNRSLRMRAYFLYAQVHQRLGNNEQAYLAFDRVTSIYTDYQYSFWAELSKGKIARSAGNLDQAYYIFVGMSRDDKNLDKMAEINFQIAKTEQALGQIENSKVRYEQILRSSINQPDPEVQAKTYYQLGRIYSEHYKRYETAAAYLDSSSATSSPSFQSREEALAFANYASLKSKEQKIDSLLALGSLSSQELELKLQSIRKTRISKLSKDARDQRNVLANINQGDVQTTDDSSSERNFGFLNYENVQLASAASNDFRAIWGNRPLVDNWRRAEAIQSSSINSQQVEAINGDNTGSSEIRYNDKDLGINIGEIPRTDEAKTTIQKERAHLQYQLGNLFFLTLNMPDSAETYFTEAINSTYTDKSLTVRSRYALHQVYKAEGQTEEANEQAERILNEHKGTVYANRIEEQLEEKDSEYSKDSQNSLLEGMKRIEQSDSSAIYKAREYRALALDNVSNELAPYIHYRALEGYLAQAKDSTDADVYQRYWSTNNTVATRSEINPFTGIYWDSVRVLVDEHLNEFEAQPYEEKINKINQILEVNAVVKSVLSCSELGIEPQVKPDMDTFLSNIEWPEELQAQKLSGSITYLITISRTGKVEDFELESTSTLGSLEKAYNKAIQEHLAFYPLEFESEISRIRCSVNFPVKN